VLGGTLGVLPAVVQRVRTRVDEIVVERARPVVEGGTGNCRATVRGLARLVRRRVYAPSAVDAMVADSG
jgi:activator of 2-hydroxyglutaryl-CoA dehydratase